MEEEAIESESPSPSPPPVKIKISISQFHPGTSVEENPGESEQKSDEDEDAGHECHVCEKDGIHDDSSSEEDEPGSKKDASIPWIRCDICNFWFHLECVHLEEYQSILIDRFHCSKCSVEHGPSKPKIKCNDTRYNFDREDEIGKPIQIGTKQWIADFAEKEHLTPTPSPDVVPVYQNGTEFMNKFRFAMDEWRRPVKILDKEGLGMNLPPVGFNIDELEKIVDVEESIDTIDVYMQQSCKMKLKSFFQRWREHPRERLYNMLSFEFSQSPLMQVIKAPELMYRLSWVHKIWRIEGTQGLDDDEYAKVLHQEHENLRPDVAMFCLLGMGGSYTDFHIDFGGSSVWYHVFKGRKVFYILEPTEENLAAFEQWTFHPQRAEIFMTFFLGPGNEHLLKRVEIREGETVMIPAGWIHAVYTPEDSIVFGGNFIHELNITMQLKIYEFETRAKYGINFMFPNFELANWYAGRALVERLAAANDDDRPLPEHLITGLNALHTALMSWKQRDREQKIEEHECFFGLIAELGKELRVYRNRTKSQSKSPSPKRKMISRNNSEQQLQNLLTGFGSNDFPGTSTTKHLDKVDRKRAKEESKVGKLSKKEAHYVSNMFTSRSDGSGRTLKPASWVVNNNVSIETSRPEETRKSKGFYSQFTKEELEIMKKAESIGEKDTIKLGDDAFGSSDEDNFDIIPEKKKKKIKKEEPKGQEAPPVQKTAKKGYATPKQRLAKKLKISWESHYANELVNFDENGDEGEVWFGRSAENRMLRFVSDKVPKNARIVDIGTGNGSVLRKLRQKGFYNLTGIDYCEEAVELARKLAKAEEAEASPKIEFRVADLIAEKTDPSLCRRFQVVLDKGTWDAISLNGDRKERLENYRRSIMDMFELHEEEDDLATRYFIVFSCNFTKEELQELFEGDDLKFDSDIPATNALMFGGKQGVTSTGMVFKKI
ncbi:hypothetical protein FO519_003104 [Halicephalobus sp. NKZ332]|nr:hypothetical protein FO519_003104 [Halicephalobus sp. NKZ332]